MLTHGHRLARASSALLARLIFHLTQYHTVHYSLKEAIKRVPASEKELSEIVSRALNLAEDTSVSDLDAIHQLGEGWVAEEAIAIALLRFALENINK